MHAHFYGCGLAEMLRARDTWPCLRPRADGGEGMLAMNGEFPFKPEYHDPRVGLADMDAQGLTRRLLTFPGALGVDLLPVAEAAAAISAFNTGLADLGAATGGRIVGLAGLPLADIELAAAELRRVRHDLRLLGVILPADYFETIASARPLAPVLKAANETGALVMIHPGLKVGDAPPVPPDDNPQYRLSVATLQARITQNVLTLVLSDILDAHPRVSFQIVNLGGTLPFVFERFESVARHRNPDLPFPVGRLRRLWYDCASLGPRALEAAVGLYGADRILMGSDYPIFRDPPWSHAVEPARLDDADKALIAGGNAEALLARLAMVV